MALTSAGESEQRQERGYYSSSTALPSNYYFVCQGLKLPNTRTRLTALALAVVAMTLAARISRFRIYTHVQSDAMGWTLCCSPLSPVSAPGPRIRRLTIPRTRPGTMRLNGGSRCSVPAIAIVTHQKLRRRWVDDHRCVCSDWLWRSVNHSSTPAIRTRLPRYTRAVSSSHATMLCV
jgi:hypothetical protein